MNDKWLNDIHDRMSNFEIDEPVNLWNDIRSHQAGTNKSAQSAIKPWLKRMMSAAALIAIAFTAVYLIHLKYEIKVPETTISEAVKPLEEDPAIIPDIETPEYTTEHRQVFRLSQTKHAIATVSTPDIYASPTDTTVVVKNDNQSSENEQHVNEVKTPAYNRQEEGRKHKYKHHIRRPLPQKSNPGNVYLSVYTSGGYNYNGSRSAISGAEYSSTGTNGAIWEDNPMLGILMLNQGKEIKSDIHHRLPIRTGLSVAYSINDRISLESGLSYTNLTSDVREGSDSHYLSGEQILHYVGIPLNVKYRIVSWKRLDTYASCGILAEKCVSGKTNTQYVIDNHEQESETHSTMDKPVQWSANASVGVHFNISQAVGIYAEPGISYYIDNGSSVRTIFKDKPLNFNLNVGLRFNLNH